ncbi:Peroxisomal NADH pyrophosphatase nudt12 [Apophysomyces sp. BC1015]|nr:Peroxisomal NADH pyrophosphatase nudt12 [Apophysomyces sp. BC1015]KAG0169171.1 Peroxisomal NADH pyrophosphatase nudt12 [Apophysomyces sp. BC1021]
MSYNVFEAAAEGDVAYLKRYSQNLDEKNERGWTVLHFAARYGQVEATEYLTQHNMCELTAVNAEGKTALQLAQFWGWKQVVEILQHAAEPKGKNSPYLPKRPHFFAESPLNRWYRSDKTILGRLLRAPTSKFVVLSNLNLLISDKALSFASYDDVALVVEQFDKEAFCDEFTLVFLGIDEANGKGEDGVAYWALDITPKGIHTEEFNKLIKDFEARQCKFLPAQPAVFLLDHKSASIVAQARAMVDWNSRNQFCPACGRKTISDEGGHKRVCPPQPDSPEVAPCVSQKGIHNIAYPRTDPVIIVCIVHPNEDKILLGRQASWPQRVYSCIAGFVEAGESIEEAVRREAWEETGIMVDRVYFHSSQPWPFPNSLMLGFIAEGTTADIRLEDKELDAAGWFSRTDVQLMLKGENTAVTLPPQSAIAYQLLKSWAVDKEWSPQGLNAKM